MLAGEETKGPRARKLDGMFDKAVDKCLSSLSYAHVESLFPALVKSEKLQKSHAEMIDSLKENVYKDFAEIVAKTSLTEKLNLLDSLTNNETGTENESEKRPKPQDLELKMNQYFDDQKFPITLDDCLKLKAELLKQNDTLLKSIHAQKESLQTESSNVRAIMDQVNQCRKVLSEFGQKQLPAAGSKIVKEMIASDFAPIQDFPAPLEQSKSSFK